MNLYFEVPRKFAVYMRPDCAPVADPVIDDDKSLSIAEKTLAKWLAGNDDYKNQRLKLIPYVAEGPWVVRNMVTGRPALIGKKLPVSYQQLGGNCHHHDDDDDDRNKTTGRHPSTTEWPLLTATLDVGNGRAAAKRIVSVCRRYMSALTVDIGFVIQAEEAQELPEQMLGAIRVHGPDPLKAPKLH
jgi:hypothetical protein